MLWLVLIKVILIVNSIWCPEANFAKLRLLHDLGYFARIICIFVIYLSDNYERKL